MGPNVPKISTCNLLFEWNIYIVNELQQSEFNTCLVTDYTELPLFSGLSIETKNLHPCVYTVHVRLYMYNVRAYAPAVDSHLKPFPFNNVKRVNLHCDPLMKSSLITLQG